MRKSREIPTIYGEASTIFRVHIPVRIAKLFQQLAAQSESQHCGRFFVEMLNFYIDGNINQLLAKLGLENTIEGDESDEKLQARD